MKTAWQSLLYIRCRKRKKDKTLESLMKEENKLLTFDRAGFYGMAGNLGYRKRGNRCCRFKSYYKI